jgi:hypothetical protein
VTEPDDDETRRRRAEEERRRRRKKDDDGPDVEDVVEAPGMICDGCSLARRSCSGRRSGGSSGDGCNACDLLLMSLSLSAVLRLVAGALPRRRGSDVVVALIRGYQRLLSRFTPSCPQTPSCSAYAVDAVRTLGPRRGIRAAAARIRTCGIPG